MNLGIRSIEYIRDYVNEHIQQPEDENEKKILDKLIELCESLEIFRDKYCSPQKEILRYECIFAILSELYLLVDLYRIGPDMFKRNIYIYLKDIEVHEKIINKYLPCIYSPYDPENLLPGKEELSKAYYKFKDTWLSLETDFKEILIKNLDNN